MERLHFLDMKWGAMVHLMHRDRGIKIMIMILMEWAYMATLSFLMGFACLAPFRKKGGCQIHSAVTYMMAGAARIECVCRVFQPVCRRWLLGKPDCRFAAVIGGMLLRRDLADFFKISENTGMSEKNGKKRRRD